MRLRLSGQLLRNGFPREVEERSGQNLMTCYQCGNCSAGCPAAFAMDLLPSQLVRLIQLGQEEEVMSSRTVRLCASCLTCTVRCPRGVDFARIVEALRFIALKRGEDLCGPSEIPEDLLERMPQQGLVGGFRKLSV